MIGTRALISSMSLFSRSRRIFSALFRSSRDELSEDEDHDDGEDDKDDDEDDKDDDEYGER